jgi:hypothetical protein
MSEPIGGIRLRLFTATTLLSEKYDAALSGCTTTQQYAQVVSDIQARDSSFAEVCDAEIHELGPVTISVSQKTPGMPIRA